MIKDIEYFFHLERRGFDVRLLEKQWIREQMGINWLTGFIIHPCDPTVGICYLIGVCDKAVCITHLVSHSSSLCCHTIGP